MLGYMKAQRAKDSGLMMPLQYVDMMLGLMKVDYKG